MKSIALVALAAGWFLSAHGTAAQEKTEDRDALWGRPGS